MALDLDSTGFETARRTMVDCQVRPSDVTSIDLIEAMLWAPREAFLPKAKRAQAYVGEHLPVAEGRYELDPRIFAKMVDAAAPASDDLALVVGSGYGYAAAVLSKLTAAVIALEEDEAMAQAAATSFSEVGVDNVVAAQGALTAGCVEHQPYNLIFVNGAIETAPPAALLGQLAEGGRLVAIRMSGPVGRCELWLRDGETTGARPAFDASAPVLPGFAAAPGFVF